MSMADRHRIITISVMKHRKTGLLIATSDEMRGLFVHGQTDDELTDRIPQAITALLEAEGHMNVTVKPAEPISIEAMASFEPITRRFELLEAA